MNEIIDAVPEAKETGLEQYCEFIEDCEFPELTIKILYILGEKGPKTTKPATFVRFIFNRIILETAAVRAASVTALARFGVQCPSLTEDVCILLKRCFYDSNDEVRDRAVLYHSTLRKYPPKVAKGMLFPKQTINLKDLESSLIAYLEKPQTEPFDSKKIVASTSSETKSPTGTEPTDIKSPPPDIKTPTTDEKGGSNSNRYTALLQSIPEIKELGPIWKSSEPVNLTESETEYVVTCVKHTYPGYVLFQFNVTNKMEDQLLENVTVEMECEKEDWVSEFVVPETQLKYGVAGVTFVALQRPEKSFASGSITCTLNFFFKDVDTSSGEVDQVGVEDQYQLEDMEVKEGDFMRTSEDVGLVEFRRQWETLGESAESVKKYSLGLETLQAAVDAVVELLGMTACEKSGKVADGARSHTVNLAGTYFGDVPVLARAAFLLDTKPAVTLKIAVRSKDSHISQLLVNAIR
jgi:coatomer protein complex subunit gamma